MWQHVRQTPELERVRDLPRRSWQDDIEPMCAALTAWLRTPNGEQRLRPVQAAFLRDAHDCRGALTTAAVGEGKTLMTLLAPIVLDAKRPLLLVPASAVAPTFREAFEYARHWRIPAIPVMAYQTLGHPMHQHDLERIAPDLIIADECHYLRNRSAAVTRRVGRYLRSSGATFLGLSGTAFERQILASAHLQRWALREGAPLPRAWDELELWALAVDEKVSPDARADGAALETLWDSTEGDEPIDRARHAYGKRFAATPGIVTTSLARPDAGLTITVHRREPSRAVAAAVERLRQLWETPNGEPFEQALDLWRHARTVAQGVWYRWDPPAPLEWLAARRAWSKYVRGVLANSRKLDSAGSVALAIDRGAIQDQGQLAAWRAIRGSFEPNPVPEWICGETIQAAREWLADGGLCWVEHRAVGERLSRLTGIPYFSTGACDAHGQHLDAYRGEAAIVSSASCREKLNLQRYNRNLVLSPPSTNKAWEQLMGRTHRTGQERDVTVDVLVCVEEQEACLAQAIRDASFSEKMTGQVPKLRYADMDRN